MNLGCPSFDRIQALGQRYPGIDVEALRASVQLNRLSRDLASFMDAHYARADIARSRFLVLVRLLSAEAGGSFSPTTLAEEVGVTRAAMTGLLDTLVDGGMVSRKADPDDRRAVTIELTEKGRRYLDRMLPDHLKLLCELVADLTPEERSVLQRIDEKVSARLRSSGPTLKAAAR